MTDDEREAEFCQDVKAKLRDDELDREAAEAIGEINASLGRIEAIQARKRATPPERTEPLFRPKDWADMATYFLPMTTLTGAYIEADGSSAGAVAVCLLTAVLVALLHLANSFRP
jgi:hypothetical protein